MMREIIRRSDVYNTGGPVESLLKNQATILQKIYGSRGINSEAELDYQLKNLIPPAQLHGIDDAVERLQAALAMHESILIVGDFDADGATSCAVAIRGLHALGFEHIDFLVPNRFEYGYGLTPEIVDVAHQLECPAFAGEALGLIITVDNGIAANAGVDHANELGIDVLVTDHHLPGDELPNAVAIVNPNQPACTFPSKNLAGVGVMFYLLLALRRALMDEGWFEGPIEGPSERQNESKSVQKNSLSVPNFAELLDIVALGTVADVVPLDYNNRILVEQGLRRIRSGKACAGIRALLQCAGKDARFLTTSDLGFSVGPRLNAAGRMEDMSIGIRCLLSDDDLEAAQIAEKLDSLNKERRSVEASMVREAEGMLDSLAINDKKNTTFSLCLFDPQWHQGVIGILASRLKDRYHRPTIAFAAVDDSTMKGSARSIPGLHIRDVLDETSRASPELIKQFGGHAMAAGLSLDKDKFDEFAAEFEKVVAKHLANTDLKAQLLSDGELSSQELNLATATQLRYAGPWGQGNPEPLFDGRFKLIKQRIVGEKHLKVMVAPVDAPSHVIDGIAFNVDTSIWPDPSATEVTLAYKLDVNRYREQDSVQLLVELIKT